MNKIIALNWKQSQTTESAQILIKTVEDIRNIYPDYSWIVFPGDEIIDDINTWIPLGNQKITDNSSLPYCIVGHMSERMSGKTDVDIQKEIQTLSTTNIIPLFCIGPVREEDTLKSIIENQLSVLEYWPEDKEIIIAYEPGFGVWTGKSMTLEDIEIITDILQEATKSWKKHILYGGSVNDVNIAQILEITDGVIIGAASQKSASLLAISIALWQQ